MWLLCLVVPGDCYSLQLTTLHAKACTEVPSRPVSQLAYL